MDSRDSIEEFATIKAYLTKRKIRGWLFGGTAFTYAHGVRKRLSAGQDGLPKGTKLRSLYQRTQDLDIVIDGSEEEAKRLENYLNQRFPHRLPLFLGNKSAWEVRLLQSDRDKKIALLNSPQFLGIHNDSGSTGLIELTDPSEGHSQVRDVSEWNNEDDCSFFNDLLADRLSYHYSPIHTQTRRYQKGKNPEIFSVIRYLTKLLQENLPFDGELATKYFIPIIENFRGLDELHREYGIDRLQRLVGKMLLQSNDVERAWTLIGKLGLRKALLKVGDPKTIGTTAWWMTLVPVKSYAVGSGSGTTAADLGFSEVVLPAAGTVEYFRLLESSNPTPNIFATRYLKYERATVPVLESFLPRERDNHPNRLWVRYELAPEAREGRDFIRDTDNRILVGNRSALRLSPNNQIESAEALQEKLLHWKLDTLDSPAADADKYQYLSENARQIAAWLHEDPGGIGPSPCILAFLRITIRALNEQRITSRDFRRLVARYLGLVDPSDKDFLEEFRAIYEQSPELQRAFINHRGVFVDSLQPDAREVRLHFEQIEKALTCARAILDKQ